MLSVSIFKKYFRHGFISRIFQVEMIDQEINIYAPDVLLIREHQVWYPPSDNANIIFIFIE